MGRRAWVAAGVVGVLVVGATAAWSLDRARHSCGDAVTSVSAARSSSPFLDDAGRKQQPDADRDRAVASLGTAPAPFGPVVGAVGYHYEQWAQVSAYDQGIGIRTRDNPDFTMLDDQTLKPLWSVRIDTRRSAYDADEHTYLVATMPGHGPPELVALDASTGRRRWCASLGGPHVGGSDPFATELLPDGGVVVLGPGSGHRVRVVRLDARGKQRWATEVEADQGDFLGSLGEGLVVVGGRPGYELSDEQSLRERRAGTSLRALDLGDGRTVWRTTLTSGAADHVVGVHEGLTIVEERAAGQPDAQLVWVDEEGTIQNTVVEPRLGPAPDAALLGDRVVVRGPSRWTAFDAAAGARVWTGALQREPQLLPYGFQLDDVPLLDATHALVGTTTGLRVLDLRTGSFTATAPLPVDGINTTYWPYQVAVSPHLVAVATNTSAVVLRRR